MPGKYLTEEERDFVVFEIEKGYSYREVRWHFRERYHRLISISTIGDVFNRYLERGTNADAKKPGRPSLYNVREKRILRREAINRSEESVRDLAHDRLYNPKRASKSTVNTILIEGDIFSRVLSPRYGDLTKLNIKDRKAFAKSHRHWALDQWKLVIFSDESDIFTRKCGRKYIRNKRR